MEADHRPEPVTMEALAGAWLLASYGQALVTSRSPLAATRVAEPLGLLIRDHGSQRELVVTSFHETLRYQLRGLEAAGSAGAATLVLAPAEAGEPEAPAERWRRVPVELWREGDGDVRMRAALWGAEGPEEIYQRLPSPVATWVNARLLAGEYRDQKARPWRFTTEGWASTPDESFPFEISLDISETDCDYLRTPDPNEPGGQRRIGFDWEGETLHLYRITYDRPAPISCEKVPWVVLRVVK